MAHCLRLRGEAWVSGAAVLFQLGVYVDRFCAPASSLLNTSSFPNTSRQLASIVKSPPQCRALPPAPLFSASACEKADPHQGRLGFR